MDCGYYDCKLGRYVTIEEIKKNMTKEPEFSKRPKIHKCTVCDEQQWCNKKEKMKTGCNEFILNEEHLFSEVYKKQNNIK